MRTALTITFISIITFCLQGQELKLKLGDREKTFDETSVYEIHISESKSFLKKPCCNFSKLTGEITFIGKDSLGIKLSKYESTNTIENVNIAKLYLPASNSLNVKIARDEIMYLRHYKSSKIKSFKRAINIPAGILMFATASTLVNTFFVAGKDNKNNLLKLGGAQLALGITCIIIGKSKRYYFKDLKDPGVYFTFSTWEHEEDLETYRQSSLFRDTWQKTKPLFAARAEAWSVQNMLK